MSELYAAACLYARDQQLDRKSEDKDVHEFVKCMAEKFSELIVNECVSAVEDTNDRYRKDYFANKIKEHFGVEEK
jgi:hypothetical protein